MLDYFKRRNSLRRLRVWLSIAGLTLAVLWLLAEAMTGRSNLYSPGELSASHAFVGKNCTACHTGPQKAVFSRAVTNRACESCHSGSIHHANQIVAGKVGAQPACSSCHEEHRGREFRPAMVRDSTCVECHNNLPLATAGQPSGGYAAAVTSFSADHPEFRVIAEHQKDQAQIKLNHRKHMRADLPGPDGHGVQMECSDCHHVQSDGAMAPVAFDRDCRSCHPLAFDARIREQVPHEEPVIIEAFVRTAISKHTGNNPNEWKNDIDWHPARKLAELRRMVEEAPRNLPAALETQIAADTRFLFQKKCQECHVVQSIDAPIPVIVKPEIPGMWLKHAHFSHTPHRMLHCEECHTGARDSSLTSDVLLPSRSKCVQCHNPSAAPSTCATCHKYHGSQ